jgi:hypothetical protein
MTVAAGADADGVGELFLHPRSARRDGDEVAQAAQVRVHSYQL